VNLAGDPFNFKPTAGLLRAKSVPPNVASAIQGQRGLYIAQVSELFICTKEPLQQPSHNKLTSGTLHLSNAVMCTFAPKRRYIDSEGCRRSLESWAFGEHAHNMLALKILQLPSIRGRNEHVWERMTNGIRQIAKHDAFCTRESRGTLQSIVKLAHVPADLPADL
jgi:hypothetical protein